MNKEYDLLQKTRTLKFWSVIPDKPRSSLIFMICLSVLSMISDSCIIPFEPQIDKYENLLVVEGLLTDEPGSCEVKLSRTYPYDTRRSYYPEINAFVYLTDDQGNITVLEENAEGVYVCGDENFAGETGRKYKIVIETESGEKCESAYEELKPSVPIDDIYFRYVNKGRGIKALELYVDTHDPTKQSLYYAWNYYETWEIRVPYVSAIYETYNTCFIHVNSRSFLTKTTKGYSEDKVAGFPLYYIDNTTNRLAIKYSTLIKQYVLTEETYNFYENLKSINENVGTLYDKIPVILKGNMINSEDPVKPILGNFQVSGVSEMRIFIDNIDLPLDFFVPDGYEFCMSESLTNSNSKELIDSLRGTGWIVIDSVFISEDTTLTLTNSRACFDCSVSGVPEFPDFWY